MFSMARRLTYQLQVGEVPSTHTALLDLLLNWLSRLEPTLTCRPTEAHEMGFLAFQGGGFRQAHSSDETWCATDVNHVDLTSFPVSLYVHTHYGTFWFHIQDSSYRSHSPGRFLHTYFRKHFCENLWKLEEQIHVWTLNHGRKHYASRFGFSQWNTSPNKTALFEVSMVWKNRQHTDVCVTDPVTYISNSH